MPDQLIEPAAYTIDAFCRAHSIGKTSFYELRKSGLAPKMMRVRGRVLISREAAADWRRQMEQAETAETVAA